MSAYVLMRTPVQRISTLWKQPYADSDAAAHSQRERVQSLYQYVFWSACTSHVNAAPLQRDGRLCIYLRSLCQVEEYHAAF